MKSFEELTCDFLKWLLEKFGCEDKSNFKGEFMYIVKNDNPDVGYSLSYSVTDAEGEAVAVEETEASVTSTDEAVVSVDEDGETIHFGQSGVASINVEVKDKDTGALLGSFGAQFTVTTGDPAAIAGGTIVFEGLEEAEEPTPEPPIEEPPVEEPPVEEPPVEEPPVEEPPVEEPPVEEPTPIEEPVEEPVIEEPVVEEPVEGEEGSEEEPRF